jgi:hypothetical protein
MAIWTRLDFQNKLKSAFGLDRTTDDGLLTNALIQEAINDAMKQVADDCNLIDGYASIALRQGQWKYPMDDRVLSIRRAWWQENGQRNPVDHLEPEDFLDGHDPTELDSQPYYYSYPHKQGPMFRFYVKAAPITDYLEISRVTQSSRRTLIDSGASFGRTHSGNKVIPKSLVYNNDDHSFGYVDRLDMLTPTTGTAGASTSSSLLVDGGQNFNTMGVEEGWLITDAPSDGIVTKWAFVTEVLTDTSVGYEDYEGGYFSPGEDYRIGICNKIWLSIDAPFRGLRRGSDNTFDVAGTVTITGSTVFTETRVTGTISGTPVVGQEAIASGGSHGKISAVASGYVDVDFWIGGQPVNGETVAIQTCDEYQIQSRFRTESVMWIRPTPNANDTEGVETLHFLFNDTPVLPERDSDPIEIDEHYFDPLFAAGMWKCTVQKGSHGLAEVTSLRTIYQEVVKPYLADANEPPRNEPLRPYQNQRLVRSGRSDTGPSGVAWDWRE